MDCPQQFLSNHNSFVCLNYRTNKETRIQKTQVRREDHKGTWFLPRLGVGSEKGTGTRPTSLQSSPDRRTNRDTERDGDRQSRATAGCRLWTLVRTWKRKRSHDTYVFSQTHFYRTNRTSCTVREGSFSWMPKATRTKRAAIIPKPYFPIHSHPYQFLHLARAPPTQKPMNRHLSGNSEESSNDERDRCTERRVGDGKEGLDDLSRKKGISIRLRSRWKEGHTLKS